MKVHSLDKVQDKLIGKKGTPDRDKFEQELEKDIVKNLRKVRDQINLDIKDMTFKQERAYLDKLLDKDKEARKG